MTRKSWYQKNKERLLKEQKEYYRKNIEKKRAYAQARYYQKKDSDEYKSYLEKTRLRRSRWQKNYYQKNREKLKLYGKNYWRDVYKQKEKQNEGNGNQV